MKIKLNSSNYTVELKDQTPFIQGTDDIRNIIELYCEPNFVTDAVISYVYQNGRSSIAMPNNTKTLTTLESANYELILFRLPNIATANSGQLMASIVVTTADGKHKFNITNSVLKASDFETFEKALEGTAAEVRASISAMSESISEVEDDLTAYKLAQLAALNLKADKSTTYTKTETNALLDGKVDKITPEQPITSDSVDDTSSTNHKFVSTDEKTQITTNKNDIEDINEDIDEINDKIPEQASSSNQLADKDFVNSSIATATATFRGTYNLVSDLQLDLTVTHAQVVISLNSNILIKNENDYVYVQVPTDESTPTQIAQVDRYKYGTDSFEYEYTLNNSGFTSEQWAALNSGATVTNIGKIATNESAINGIKNGTSINSFGAAETEFSHKVDKEYASTYVNNILENSINGVKGQSSFDSTLPEGHTDLLAEYILKGIAQFSSSGKKDNDVYKTILSLTPQGASLVETKDNVTQKSLNLWDLLNKVDKSYIGYVELDNSQNISSQETYDNVVAQVSKKYCVWVVPSSREIFYKVHTNSSGNEYSFATFGGTDKIIGFNVYTAASMLSFHSWTDRTLETTNNKVTSISSSSTDSQYPSAKCVYDELEDKVTKNEAITGATKTKITYDSKGLVTGGADLEASDIPSLDAAKITSGTFADERIASAATWNGKEDPINKVTSISSSSTDTEYPSAKAVHTAINTAIENLPKSVIFKGSLGVTGTITTLPSASSSNEGYEYKVITAGTYQSIVCKVGDLLISNGSTWILIPSGDEPSGTVTSVNAEGASGSHISVSGGAITESGTFVIDVDSGYSIPTTEKQSEWDNKQDAINNVSSTTTITPTTVSLTLYYTDNTSETITVMTGASASTTTTIS